MSNLLAHKSVRVKKSTRGHHAPTDGSAIRGDHELTDRLQQWKHIDKSLLAYYQGLAAIEQTTSKTTLALMETIQVPFHEGHHFLGEGGWQEVLYGVRDETKRLSELHDGFSKTVTSTVVKELQGVRAEIKSHIAAIEKEAGVLGDEVDKERASSAAQLTQLQSSIEVFSTSSEPMLPQHDPYLGHIAVSKQLTKQVHKENDYQAALIRFQQQQPTFEETIAKNIQSAARLYEEAKKTRDADIAASHHKISELLQSVSPTAEYEFYSSQEGTVLDPNTPSRSVNAISFPGLNHASSKPIKEGHLERKKRFTKSYKESYYVLTPSGYLHERTTSDPSNTSAPGFSIFLPESTLGVPAKESDKSHKFHVEGNKAHKSTFETKMKHSLRFGGRELAYTFRARTHAEMMAWWNKMDELSRNTKTAVEPVDKNSSTSPIQAAVFNVGYASPDQEEVVNQSELNAATVESEDEEGGSSAEEEEEEERQARTAPTTPAPEGGLTSPLDEAGQHVNVSTLAENPDHPTVEPTQGSAEVLPTYAGNPNGVSTAEKAALSEKGGAPVLGNVVPVNVPDDAPATTGPVASTST